MDNIPEVASTVTNIVSAEFVRLRIFNEYTNTNAVSTLTFSSSYKDETIGGEVYNALGGMLQVGSQTRDIRVTSGDTAISLSGIDGNNIAVVLSTKIRGSEVEITRGFYDQNMVLANTYTRFRGIVTNYNISEDREERDDNFTVSVSASSYKTILENRIAGRKTNKESWRYFYPNDAGMDNVYSITGVAFDFGQKPNQWVSRPGVDPFNPFGPFDSFPNPFNP